MTGVALRALIAALPLLSGCALFRSPEPPPPPAVVEVIEDPVPVDWTSVVTPEDQDRIGRLSEAWRQGLAAAARYRSAIAAEGALLDPDAAQPRAAPTPGTYACRVVKLGGRMPFAAFKPFHCFVDAEGELLTMVKASGSQRPAGRLWMDGDTRQIFLGAMSRDDEPPPYGEAADRDVAGVFERVGPFRWRLVVPFPTGGALLDVYELVPQVATEP
jgi:hypothetical protein